METRLYTRTNPDNGQIEIKHYEITPDVRPDEPGPVWMTHFWGTEASASFFAAHSYYDDADVLWVGDSIYLPSIEGPLPDFLETTWKEHDAEGWVLLPAPEPHEYTCAGSPVAVLRADGSNHIEVAALPGSRTVEGSLEKVTYRRLASHLEGQT